MTVQTRPRLFTLLMLLATLLIGASLVACEAKKEEETKTEEQAEGEGTAPAESTEAPAEDPAAADTPAEDPGAAAADTPADDTAAAEDGEYIKFVIDHSDSSKGLVNGSFEQFELVSASVDLANPANAFAEFKVDPNSFKTDNDQRDGHVKSPDFLDVVQFPDATFRVHDIKPVDGQADSYTATATLKVRDVEKDLPVNFQVVEKKDDGSVTIEGGAEMMRMDWGVGAAPAESGAANEMKFDVRLNVMNKG